ncbi:hypothetical protein EP51_14330 [Rhodococcus opacus]|uniref:Uncharacterized protein n=1 Tax=Rhodococcus opacus TaxID=37919 RepID=A0A076EHP5_RHOOP|nr:hypothetical protein EP51_14330 [Rhodococcus opacus]
MARSASAGGWPTRWFAAYRRTIDFGLVHSGQKRDKYAFDDLGQDRIGHRLAAKHDRIGNHGLRYSIE